MICAKEDQIVLIWWAQQIALSIFIDLYCLIYLFWKPHGEDLKQEASQQEKWLPECEMRFVEAQWKCFWLLNSFRSVYCLRLPCCERRPQIPRASRFPRADPCGSSGESGGTGDSWWQRWRTHSPAFRQPKPKSRRSAPLCLRNTTAWLYFNLTENMQIYMHLASGLVHTGMHFNSI